MYYGFTELNQKTQDIIQEQWNHTEHCGHKFTDYLYYITQQGEVLCRKHIFEFTQ